MNRRGFLSALVGAAVLDPERLLWIPGKKLISIPKPVIRQPEAGRWIDVYLVEDNQVRLDPPIFVARWQQPIYMQLNQQQAADLFEGKDILVTVERVS